jgi:hypothetical protein
MKLLTFKNLIYGVDGPYGYPNEAQSFVDNAVNTLNNNNVQDNIVKFVHPEVKAFEADWIKYRDCYEGGSKFVEKYAVRMETREDLTDFTNRKKMSYCPAISKSSVIMIKNAVSAKLSSIVRKGGTKTYQDSVNGDKWGVDKLGSSMNTFINKEILPELLALGKVGVYIDHPVMSENFTMSDRINNRPYLYVYRREDIRAWVPDDSHEPNQFSVLLLRDHYLKLDDKYGLPLAWCKGFRLYRKVAGEVIVEFYNEDGALCNNKFDVTKPQQYTIKLPVIPFVTFEITESLLKDVADYQIAQLHLVSSDMEYAVKSNFPFYTEQFDGKGEPLTKGPPQRTGVNQFDGVVQRGYRQTNDLSYLEVRVGATHGRRYPINTERPGFINPSDVPLRASMAKQEQIKVEIKEILSLTLSNITAGSARISEQDRKQGLESGLSNVGAELEYGERRIAAIWSLYEGAEIDATITYPQNYSVKSDADRIAEATAINTIRVQIPSSGVQKDLSKEIVTIMLSGKVPNDVLQERFKEIDDAATMTSDWEAIASDVQLGLVDNETASQARGYPKGVVEKAKIDHADRIARVQAAQSAQIKTNDNAGARGVGTMSTDPAAAKHEKQLSQSTVDGNPDSTKTRGDA